MLRLLHGLRQYRWLLIVAALVFALDLQSKQWIAQTLPSGAYYGSEDVISVIPEWFYIVHVYNPGAAWGLFAGYSFALAFLGLGAIILLFIFRKYLELNRPFLQGVFGLLCGGILGNLVDRIYYGHVLDFILVILPGGYHWPAFNIADIAICSGSVLYMIYIICESFTQRTSQTPPPNDHP